ncbi:MAG: PEP-CTERM sorting domain-containing protein [Verrucomicrobia bacterium]|nr:PEP-CTERM sorting domain-containing protein [Verrucomicrobiota bacterium]
MNKLELRVRALLVVSGLVVASSIQAAVVFTVSGTARSSLYGYTAGQSVVFTFTTNDGYAGQHSLFETDTSQWDFEGTGTGQLWASISGTGLTGQFIPASDTGSEVEVVYESDPGNKDGIGLFAVSDSGLGLFSPSGDALSLIGLSIFEDRTLGNHPASYVDITSYFSGYVGDIPFSSSALGLSVAGFSEGMYFDVTQMNISTSAIPEPSTYAALVGAVVLGVTFYRRRRVS